LGCENTRKKEKKENGKWLTVSPTFTCVGYPFAHFEASPLAVCSFFPQCAPNGVERVLVGRSDQTHQKENSQSVWSNIIFDVLLFVCCFYAPWLHCEAA